MAIDWDLYQARLTVNGSTQRDRLIKETQTNIANKIVNSPSCRECTKNGSSQSFVIIETSNEYIKEIKALPDATFTLGDLIVLDSKNYLVTEQTIDGIGQTKGKITQCNYTLRFQNKTTGAILSYPSIFSTKGLTNTGEIDFVKMIYTIEGKATLALKYDSYTQMFNEGERIIVDGRTSNLKPATYKISHVNDIERYSGLIILSLERDTYNESTDRADLGVCDYFTITSSSGSASIIYSSNCEIKVGGSYKTFAAHFYDSEGEVLNLTPIWSISSSVTGATSNFTTIIDALTKTIKIKCANLNSLIGSTLTLTLTESSDTYSATLIINVVSLI